MTLIKDLSKRSDFLHFWSSIAIFLQEVVLKISFIIGINTIIYYYRYYTLKSYEGGLMNYFPTVLKEDIIVKKIFTVHYFEFAKSYVYEGEKHDFWEFVYVDKGEVEVLSETQDYKLKQGEMIFHKPNEFHNLWANGKVAPNVVIVSFECKSKATKFFRDNKIICIGDYEKNLLAQIIREAQEAFRPPFNVPALPRLERSAKPAFGCEQLIRTYLEQLLISLIRKGTSIITESRISSAVKERSDEDMVKKITIYLKGNLSNNITFDDVRRYSKLSSTNLKVVFKEQTGTSVMNYFKTLKIEESKKMIREELYNFTEIASKLGYKSIHYFSRQFKNITNMTPSQYASSVKIKI